MIVALPTELESLVKALEEVLASRGGDDDKSHDVHHARRVMATALEIALQEDTIDRSVLIAAAYLHDLVNVPKNSPDRCRASALSAERAGPELRAIGFDERQVAAARHAITAHSFTAGVEPATLEAKILQDADRLEAIGAIGIARTFYVAGRLGGGLFDGDDPFAARRPLDDRRFAVDHFAVKLLKLPATMKTRGGRALAEERAATMRAFLLALAKELGQPSPW